MTLRFATQRPELVERIQADAAQLQTVQDVLDYARVSPSPIVGELLRRSLEFFMEDCSRPQGGRDWKKIKVRQQRGLRRRIGELDLMDPTICQACLYWMLWEGRDIGTGFLDAMMSQAVGGISDPRSYAQDLLRVIAARVHAPAEA